LANLLRKIAWLLPLSISLAAPAPFSHKVHLQKKLICVVCHTGAAKSVKAEDNLLPNAAVCAGCHKDSKQIKTPRTLTVSKFNHGFHAKLPGIGAAIGKAIDSGAYLGKASDISRSDLNATNACMACHRGLERSDEVSLSAFPHMADCLVCHNKVDPPFSCVKCHAENAQLKPASHTNDWLDRHSSRKTSKDTQTCAVCHGRQFTCLGCH
jgi:cytochrome c7-like protein